MVKKTAVYDVVIVGAGVIGSALALHLSKLNYKVALLDKAAPSYASTNPERVIALSQGSAQYLQELGVWEPILAFGAGLIQHIDVREPGNKGALDMSHESLDSPALGYVLETRHVLEPIQQALQANHVDMIYPATVTALEETRDTTMLHIQHKEGKQTLSTYVLVGADGTNSFIRKLAGIRTKGWDHNRLGIVASIEVENGHGNIAHECFKQEGPLALLPLADNRFSLVWSVSPKYAMELLVLDDQGFLLTLEREAGAETLAKTGRFLGLGKRASFPLELRIAQRFAKNNVLLVGNAAHTIHPVAGQGMNLGLRDVAVLADILGQSWAKEDLSKPLIGQTYAERRRADTWAVAGFTEGVLQAFSAAGLPVPWLRGKGLDVLQHQASLKQLLLKQAAGVGQLKGLKL